MTYSSRLLIVLSLSLSACVPAKSPLDNAGEDGATFAVFQERLKASSELGGATKESFGRPRTQILHFTVCLQSRATGQGVAPGSQFAVTDGGGGRLERSTGSDGCVRWDEEHRVSISAPERNLRVERTIEALGSHRGRVTLPFVVKPWLEGSDAVQAVAGRDKFADAINANGSLKFDDRYPTTGGQPTASDVDGQPHFDLADSQLEFTYTGVGPSEEFEMDPFLNLIIPYHFTYSLAPRITRKLFSGMPKAEVMTTGKVRITMVFFASARGQFKRDGRYLTSTQFDAEIGPGGRVAGSLVLKYPHMLYGSGRQTVLVQISAPDQTDIQPRSFSGSISVIDHRGTLTALPDGRDADLIHETSLRERTARARARRSPFTEYVRSHDVVRTDVAALPTGDEATPRAPWMTKIWQTLGVNESASQSLASTLCRQYLKQAGIDVGLRAEWYCPRVAATSAIRVQRLDFVENMPIKAPRNVSIRTYSNIDFGVMYNRDSSTTTAVGFGLRAGTPETLGIVSGNVGYEKSWSNTLSHSGRFGQSQTLAVDVGMMDVYAGVRSCLLVTGLIAPFTAKPWLICSTVIKPAAWIPEEFYYYSQMFGSNHSPLIDPFNAQSGIKMLVRGHAHMNQITQDLKDTDFRNSGFSVLVNAHTPELAEYDTLGKVDDLTIQGIPGAFTRE